MSFFEDLLGGLATSGAQGLGEISARNQREDEMKLQNELAIERQKAAESIRLDLEEKQRQAKQQRLSEQRQAVEAAAPAATQARELSQAQKMAPSVDGNVMDVIKSKLTPAQMQKFYGVDQGPVATLDDKLGVARDKGLYDAEAQLSAERKQTVESIRDANKAALDQRRLDLQQEQIAAGERSAARRADATEYAADARAARTSSDQMKYSLTTDKANLLRELAQYSKDGRDDTDPAVKAARESLADVNQLLSEHRSGIKTGASKPESKPAAAKSSAGGYPEGTKLMGPGNKPYIVKNGVPVPQ